MTRPHERLRMAPADSGRTAGKRRAATSCRLADAREQGAVLLEVVLALVLFVGAAAVISSSLNSAVLSVDRLKFETHAANLATSVMSELQMGVRSWAATAPEPLAPPFERWTSEILLDAGSPSGESRLRLRRVEVVIRQESEGWAHRLVQWVPAPAARGPEGAASGSGGVPPTSTSGLPEFE